MLGTAISTVNPLAGLAVATISKALGIEANDRKDIEKAIQTATPEQLIALKKAEHDFTIRMRELGINEVKDLEAIAQGAVNTRWTADMTSDSWLSKNIRPMVLIFILSVYTIFSLLSAADINVNQSYVELLAQWGMIVMSAYFVGRTFEKIKGSE